MKLVLYVYISWAYCFITNETNKYIFKIAFLAVLEL